MNYWGFVGVALAVAAQVARADSGYELRVPEKIDVIAGDSGTLPIAIAVDRGLAVSKDAGVVLDLAPSSGVTVKRRRLGRADAVDPDADAPRFTVAIRAAAAGDYTIALHLRFWLCGTRTCRPIDARRTVAIAAAAPPGTP